ncbi:hypothetical protein RJT34_10162 [Clitoria ternatea]|uniref:non-specific serine/threonine protein kinase n=1 Tax=Clitoria ternatea TaxID=43366 RepID=A0AAN9K919_CLITE
MFCGDFLTFIRAFIVFYGICIAIVIHCFAASCEGKKRKQINIMFAVAPISPAFSPATKPPLRAFDITPPPLMQPAPPPFYSPPSPSIFPAPSAPPASSLATSAPPALSLTVPLPTNSPPPVMSPTTPSLAAPSSPLPEILPVPPSSPPITSNESPDSPPPPPLPSPVTPLPPTELLPSPVAKAFPPLPVPFATAPVTTTIPPFTVTPSPPTPTVTFPPEEIPPPPSPAAPASTSPLETPSSAVLPASAPEVKSPPTSSTRSLPVAVEVQKPSAFHMSSGFIVGLVIGAIIFVFVVAIVSVLCRNTKKKRQKNLWTYQYKDSSSPVVALGSKGSHVIQVLSNSMLPPQLTKGGSGSVNYGSVNAIPNVGFGSVNGIFTYDELVVATNRFSESNLLGEGGFGYVYKGVLQCGKEIAVKQLKTGSQQGEREFQAEVETISRVHHKHLVELVGYCVARAERLLVYEFVPNDTLEFHLHGEGNAVMEWATRIKIALGSAKGLAYLHEDCNPAIIHRDIKASNILLDFKFEAKVSDFGLAKIFPKTDGRITHLTTRVVGTFGYLAPEYASSGKLTDKSDVYSYGVMLLELITGRPPITTAGSRNENLVDWSKSEIEGAMFTHKVSSATDNQSINNVLALQARPLLAQALQDGDFNDLVDPRLQKNYEADEMARMITCAAACVLHSARLRPRMSQIVGALEGVVSLTDLVGDITPGHTTLYSWSNSSVQIMMAANTSRTEEISI